MVMYVKTDCDQEIILMYLNNYYIKLSIEIADYNYTVGHLILCKLA